MNPNNQKLTLILLMLICLSFCTKILAQGGIHYKPLTLNLDSTGTKYIRFITWHQFWIDFNDREGDTNSADFRIRRSRFLFYAQITPKFLILTHFGINNQFYNTGGALGQGATGTDGKKPQLFLHDIWTEFQIVKDYLSLGTGLHYWNGVSRMSSASTLNFMTMDAPIFNWYVIEQTDQFARQMGIYAKGKIGRLDYRLALNKPFSFGTPLPSFETENQTGFIQNDNWATQGYLNYQFLDKENNKLPFFVGSYLGTMKVFNLGAGWHRHPGATAILENDASEPKKQDINLFGVDAFLDMPLKKGDAGALTAYAVYYNFDYGKNYTRGVLLGTGNIVYGQFGYMLPKNFLGENRKNGVLQPYFGFAYKNLEGLQDKPFDYKLGFNYYLNGHHAKITLEYSNAPVFSGGLEQERFGTYRIQTHIFL
ncbi:MAG: porin [Microscillaceae bacterium]|nr:porin [Microscillaceae bacterium]